jgi:hypothetical protein
MIGLFAGWPMRMTLGGKSVMLSIIILHLPSQPANPYFTWMSDQPLMVQLLPLNDSYVGVVMSGGELLVVLPASPLSKTRHNREY